ncbi:MAG: SDR family oxidoreductase [Sedimenticola sp.]
MIKSIPLGRVGTPEGIATAAVFLASDFSDYITGVITDIDGDFMMDKMELGDNIFKHF